MATRGHRIDILVVPFGTLVSRVIASGFGGSPPDDALLVRHADSVLPIAGCALMVAVAVAAVRGVEQRETSISLLGIASLQATALVACELLDAVAHGRDPWDPASAPALLAAMAVQVLVAGLSTSAVSLANVCGRALSPRVTLLAAAAPRSAQAWPSAALRGRREWSAAPSRAPPSC